jgi:ornithine cyclodeaminase/alanine dehydrogenase-like protein (mu-crystallin family)
VQVAGLAPAPTASEPLFEGSLLRAGAHLNAVDAHQPDNREPDDRVIAHRGG